MSCQRGSSHESPIRGGLRQPVFGLWKLFLLAQAVSSTAAVSAVAANTSKSWTLAASGDFLGDMLDSSDTSVQAVWNLTRTATFSFFNMEGQLLRDAEFTGYPSSENGGDNTYGGVGGGPTYDPDQALLLAKAGFNIASHANNHVWDYDIAGMEATLGSLAAANITAAGSGSSLAEARSASFVERDGVRISLVCAAGTHTPQSAAGTGDALDYLRPRPGISVLRATAVTLLDDDDFSTMLNVAKAQGQPGLADNTTDVISYVGQYPGFWSYWRRAGPITTTKTPSTIWEPNADDFSGILDSIRDAKSRSDAAIFSLHAHESDSGAADSDIPVSLAATTPASYILNVSRSAIDVGADVVLVHGPHTLRGIEMYRGRPIFYGLGSLTYSLGLDFRGYKLPIEWDDGLIARVAFEDGRLSAVSLHPVIHNQLTNDTTLPERTLPKVPPSGVAQRVLMRLQKVSAAFGTSIRIEGDIGYVDLKT